MFRSGRNKKRPLADKGLLFLAVPGLLFLLAFSYIPMIGIIIPFKSINVAKGIFGSPWVGFDNFEFLFTSDTILRITRNTIVWNLVFIATSLVISLAIALMLYELSSRQIKVYQTSLLIPYFLSWVVISYIVYAFLSPENGVLNYFLKRVFGSEFINWYVQPNAWPYLLTISYLWKSVGYSSILYYTALVGIDASLFEAAELDGANKLQIMTRISIPSILPVITLFTLLSLGRIFFADFGLFYFVPRDSGILYSVTDVIDTYVFRALKTNSDLGMTAAAGLYQTMAGLVLILITNKIVKKFNSELAIF